MSFSPEFPADTELAAILTFNGAGELSGGSGIFRFRDKPFFELREVPEENIATIAAVAWRAGDFSELLLPRDDVLEESLISRAAGCDPTLPAPAATLVLEGPALPAGAGPLHAAWLDLNCPNVEQDLSADTRCLFSRCPVTVEQTGCRFSAKLDFCDLGKHDFRINYRGELCLEATAPSCTQGTTPPLALARLECTQPSNCAIDFYRPPASPSFEVETREILSVPMRIASNLVRTGVRTHHPLGGYLGGMVILSDRVIVSSHDGRFVEERACDNPEPNRLHFFALTDLAEIKTATAPPCLRALVAAESGDQFFGIFGSRETQTIGRFDREGRLLFSRALDLPEPLNRYYDPVQARLSRFTGEILALFYWGDGSGLDFGGVFLGIEENDFSQRLLYDEAGASTNSFDEDASGQAAIPNDENDNLVFLRLSGAEPPLRIDIPHFKSVSVGQVEYDAPTATLAMLVPIEEPAIHTFDVEPRYRGRSVFYEHPFAPLTGVTWPTDQRLMLAAGANNELPDQPRVALALFDPIRANYLPGAQTVGFGVPSRILVSGQSAYLTLPWEGKLLRVTPSPRP